MGNLFEIIWFPGFIIAWWQAYHRVGFGDIKHEQGIDWREFLIPNVPWFVLTIAKVWFWFVPFIYWLSTGRLGSPWRAVTEINGYAVRKIMRVSPQRELA